MDLLIGLQRSVGTGEPNERGRLLSPWALMWLASVIVRLAGLSGLGACSRDVPPVVVHGFAACRRV